MKEKFLRANGLFLAPAEMCLRKEEALTAVPGVGGWGGKSHGVGFEGKGINLGSVQVFS